MALITCPECQGKLSDLAYSCPHCGYPARAMRLEQKRFEYAKRAEEPKGVADCPMISCPRCRHGQIKRSDESGGAYVCDYCGRKWTSLENVDYCRAYQGATYEEKQNLFLKYITSKDYHVSADELADCFDLTITSAFSVLKPLKKNYLIWKDESGNYFIPDEKTIQPLKSKDDPCSRTVDATILNMGVAINAEDIIMDKAKSLLAVNQYEDLRKKYTYLSEAFDNYYMSALNHQSALYSQRVAIKAKKLDPAIAGGLAQGVAGVGAGVYIAVSQQQRNQQIDEARSVSTARVRSTSSQESSAQRICENCFYDVMAYINSYPELISIYESELSVSKDKKRGII